MNAPRLFDEYSRSDSRPKLARESSFEFLNRSSRNAFAEVREKLEYWFANYPRANLKDLKGRFRGRKEFNHDSAFWELFLHELLLRLGCKIIVHPMLRDSSNHPDFRVVDPTGQAYYLEAKVVREHSKPEEAARSRVGQVLDAVNELSSSEFVLAVETSGNLDAVPSLRGVKDEIGDWLASLDFIEVDQRYQAGGWQALPVHTYRTRQWQLRCIAFPYRSKKSGIQHRRLIGIGPGDTRMSAVAEKTRAKISLKAGHYGELDAPYVVAVNVLEGGTENTDLVNALFGSEVYVATLGPDGTPLGGHLARKRDGLWTSPSGAKNTRVSQVLVGSPVLPWYISTAPLRLFQNPYAAKPLDSALSRLPRGVMENQQIVMKDGIDLGELFELPETWPGSPSE